MFVVSFDSGVERTGYAVFELMGTQHTLVEYDCIETSRKATLPQRIAQVQADTQQIFSRYKPDVLVFERLFFSINKKTAIAVAQSQGAVLALAGKKNIEVVFITPNEIKQAMTGNGNADKKSVEKMVMLSLGLEKAPKLDDTTDAIACGLTYCTMKAFYDR